ncbi:MAG: GtrA family protein [Erysipelothrix sp.]|nr:GtrA family protein [Erysipelothrix sp.]
MDWLKNLLIKYQEICNYILFGVLTTAVNIAVFILFNTVFNTPYLIANAMSIVVAIIFAFLTNKKYVFKSESETLKIAFKEFYLFVGLRLFSGFFDMFSMWVLVEFISFEINLSKLLTQFLIVILNYLGSKRYIFK